MINWIYIQELLICTQNFSDVAKITDFIYKYYEENKQFNCTCLIKQYETELIISNIPIDLAVKLENEFIKQTDPLRSTKDV